MNEFPSQNGRVQQNVGVAGQPQFNQQPAGKGKKPGKLSKFSGSKISFIVLIAVIVILLLAAIAGIIVASNSMNSGSVQSQINKNEYQAVFLNNADGQVYFGKLQDYNKGSFKLSDIYYVKVDKAVQPGQENQSNISLAKLGSEIHAPEDVMYINKSSVMFWENLKPSGQVVKAIVEYQKNPTPATTPATTTPTTPAVKKP